MTEEQMERYLAEQKRVADTQAAFLVEVRRLQEQQRETFEYAKEFDAARCGERDSARAKDEEDRKRRDAQYTGELENVREHRAAIEAFNEKFAENGRRHAEAWERIAAALEKMTDGR